MATAGWWWAADPLEVIEQVMRYFYGLGVHGEKNKAPIVPCISGNARRNASEVAVADIQVEPDTVFLAPLRDLIEDLLGPSA